MTIDELKVLLLQKVRSDGYNGLTLASDLREYENAVLNYLGTVAAVNYAQTIAEIQAALLQKAPMTHQHAIADVTGLQAAIDGKAPISHEHSADDITSGTFDPARIPVIPTGVPVVSSGALADLTTAQQAQIVAGTIVTTTDGFRYTYVSGDKLNAASYIQLADITPDWTAIANKPTTFTPSAHTHAIADVTGLQTALDGKAATSHTHTIAQVTNLQTTLDGKAATLHTHNANDINAGTIASIRLGTGGTGSGTKVLADNQTFVSLPTVSGSQGLPYVAGEYFSNVSEGAASFTTAASVNANTFILSAIVVRETVEIDAVQLIHPNTVSASVRVSLYTSALSAGQYIPDQLVTNSEQVMSVGGTGSAGTVTGVYGTPFTLSKGLYFTATLANTGMQLYRWTANYHFLRPTSSAGIPALINSYSTASFPYAPLPSTYASSTVGVQLSPIAILFRKQL